ncbi:MAG: hypothetical protein DRH32_00060 [Deltaproteobacteria bacterium]|nr:MAG: hypothetical protein DRH32_00060 [Deltaproteobacteria bacterium]
MKKITLITVALCLAVAMAIPAMATKVNVSGEYRVRGFYVDNITVDESTSESQAYYDNRLRVETVFQANDNVSVTTRFDAFEDEVWGVDSATRSAQFETPTTKDTIDFDRVYMTIMTPIGRFQIGRQEDGAWGPSAFDTDNDYYSTDSIQYIGKAGDIMFGAMVLKYEEMDSVSPWVADTVADGDFDAYYIFAGYNKDNIEVGLLGELARASEDAPIGPLPFDATVKDYKIMPYWKLQFGPVNIEGEINYECGDVQFDSPIPVAALWSPGSIALEDDPDIDALVYYIKASADLEMANVYVGYVSVSGQEEGESDMTMGNVYYGGLGQGFTPLAILTDDLGGHVLNTQGGSFFSPTGVDLHGVDLIYAGADLAVNDNLSVHIVAGQATANEDWTGDWDDEYGTEVDLGITWNIMDNVTYSATAAYLSTGDLLAQIGGVAQTNVDDIYGLMHEIKVTF